MKIIFLCGSMQPGKDGVGDYVRCLSDKVITQGHSVAVIALNDKHVDVADETIQKTNSHKLRVLRLPSNTSLKRRLGQALNWINDQDPDWLSIQFVPYAFQEKGMPFVFVQHIRKLAGTRKTHIMFHETWVGNNKLKLRIILRIQQFLIKKMVDRINPLVIHTHLPLNAWRLQKMGYRPLKLPLFSNIPVKKETAIAEKKIFRIGLFNQVQQNDTIANFLTRIGWEAILDGLKPEILIMGGADAELRAFGDFASGLKPYWNAVTYTGFLDEDSLSEKLQTCHLGLTPVPRHILGKSGSVAAFISHGIPVAAPIVSKGQRSDDIGFFSPELWAAILTQPNLQNMRKLKSAAKHAAHNIQVSAISKKFLADLENASRDCY
ncbi:hypothetical protein QTN47_20715 [Danxiaibacter flavus]|uniref:Glycosyltransferase n=1 Tax=Danxiaibacter flavus TaxID=3049108 RepID=A0ABV3ZMZ6_9BACT|nr:hypothetical protein QNM32_20720 [Chitinophagaceae bacterium DXS]